MTQDSVCKYWKGFKDGPEGKYLVTCGGKDYLFAKDQYNRYLGMCKGEGPKPATPLECARYLQKEIAKMSPATKTENKTLEELKNIYQDCKPLEKRSQAAEARPAPPLALLTEGRCPHLKGIGGADGHYCIDCALRSGTDQGEFERKSWAISTANNTCTDPPENCRFYNRKQEEDQKQMEAQKKGMKPLIESEIKPFVGMPVYWPVMSDDRYIVDYVHMGFGGVCDRLMLRNERADTVQEVGESNLDTVLTIETEAEAARAELAASRGIEVITAEINTLKAQTMQNIIEIGKRLNEAKGKLKHGEWLSWLEHAVEFSPRNAQRLMKIAEEYSNTTAPSYLAVTKLVALLDVPKDEREDFINTPHQVNGKEKTVKEMSGREVEQVVKERDQYKKERDAAKRQAAIAENDVARLETEKEKLVHKNRELENRPIDVAVAEPSEADKQRIREEATKEMAGQLAAMQQKMQEMHKQLQAASRTSEAPLPAQMASEVYDGFIKNVSSATEYFNSVIRLFDVAQVYKLTDSASECLRRLANELTALREEARSRLEMQSTTVEFPELD